MTKNHWRWPFILQGTSLQHFNPLFSSIFWSNYSAKMFPPKIYRESRPTFIVEPPLSLSYSFSPLPLSFSIFLPHSFSTFLSISTSLYISLSISTSLSLSLFLPLYLSLSTSPHSNSCSVFFVFWVYDKIWQQVPSPFRISFKCTLTNLKQLTPVLNL